MRLKLSVSKLQILSWGLAAGATVLLRLILWWRNELPFHADEAIVALMARHILGGERPLFFYGQAYMGALDAYLIAIGFTLFGESVAVVRAVQALLYAGSMAFSIAWLRKVVGESSPYFALVLFLFPPVNFLLYTAFSLGGYGEALFFGSFLLWWTWHCLQKERVHLGHGFLWGILAGLGLWCSPLTAVYVMPLIFRLLYKYRHASQSQWPFWSGLIIGSLSGLSPYLAYTRLEGISAILSDLTGARIPLNPWLRNPLWRLGLLFLAWFTVVLGMRPPWEFSFIGGPLAIVPLFLLFVLVKAVRRKPGPVLTWPLSLAGANLLLWGTTRFAGDISGRYALPSVHAWLLFLAGSLPHVYQQKLRAILIGGFAGYYALSLLILTWGPGFLNPQLNPASRVDVSALPELMDFLDKNHLNRGYTVYWIAYPLAFLSRERLIFAPRLPYHFDLHYNPGDDRYPPYTCLAMESESVAYITGDLPLLEQAIKDGFRRLGITWEEAEVRNFRVFYRLSRPVHPWDLGLSPLPEPCPR